MVPYKTTTANVTASRIINNERNILESTIYSITRPVSCPILYSNSLALGQRLWNYSNGR